ncbi:MAG: glycosyltransferase [Gemmatimonadales bacterium]
MEVLFITAALPYPPQSGATIRTYNLLRRQARRHRLHLIAYGDPRRDADRVTHLEQMCASVTVVEWRETKGTPRYYGELLLNLFSATPFVVSRFTRPAMAAAIRAALARGKIDLVCCDFVTLTLNLPRGGRWPVHLTAHNAESVLWARYLEHERNPLTRAYIWLQYRKVLGFERHGLADFPFVTCVSDVDRDRLRALCPIPEYSVVPNGVDVDYFQPRPGAAVAHRLVFTGAMDWRPNHDAVRFFLEAILPRVKREEPRVTAVLVGREPPPWLRDLVGSRPDVTLTGTVDDMRPHLAGAAVYVVPLRVGGGTRLKILEAMAMGLPMVSTSVGCEGLELAADRDLLIADTPEAFAAATLRLLRDRELATRLGRAGRQRVESTYGWESVADSLEEAWQNAASAVSV